MTTIRLHHLLIGILLVCKNLFGTFYLPQAQHEHITKTYGEAALKRTYELVALMNTLEDKGDKEKLLAVNNFFNAVPYGSDQKIWGQSDYWANRTEFIGKDRGDCEDYTFAKYFTLKQLGVKQEKMKAFYCQSLTYDQPHMVLAYFKTPKDEPYILGNYVTKILPASKRTDLKPIKLYNGADLFLAKQKKMGISIPDVKEEALKWLEIINAIRSKE